MNLKFYFVEAFNTEAYVFLDRIYLSLNLLENLQLPFFEHHWSKDNNRVKSELDFVGKSKLAFIIIISCSFCLQCLPLGPVMLVMVTEKCLMGLYPLCFILIINASFSSG